jgi:hypothetical protein
MCLCLRSPVVNKLLRTLIGTGKFELAMSVCNTCNLNKADLMAEWGLSELSIGGVEYWKSARDRFKLYYQVTKNLFSLLMIFSTNAANVYQ